MATTWVVDSVRDAIGLDVGADSFSDQVDTRDTSRVARGSSSYTNGYWSSGRRTYTTRRYDQNDQWYGVLSLDELLSAPSLTDLALDGMLAFNTAATTGQFRLTRLQLVATLEQRVAVPGPESLTLLLLSGLFAGGVARMRARNKSAAAAAAND